MVKTAENEGSYVALGPQGPLVPRETLRRFKSAQVGTDADEPNNYPAVRYNLEDHLGTSSVELEGDGSLINREEYYPFGDTSFGAFAKKRYRYVGKEKNGESGLYYYGARYYAPWMCRFVSVDPLAASYAHLTPYNYAGNKPIGDLDIDGMQGTGDDKSGGSTVVQTGDSRLDLAVNRIITDNDCHNVGITTDEHQQTTITVNGDIVAKYHPDVGFVDQNDVPLQETTSGHLLPSAGSTEDQRKDRPTSVYDPELGRIGPIKNSGATVSEARPISPSNSTNESTASPSYNDEKKSGLQTFTEKVEKGAGLSEPIIGKTSERFQKERTVREQVRKAAHWISKKFDGVKSGKVYQGVKKLLPKIANGLKWFSRIITPVTVLWEIATDTWDAHTAANAAMFFGLLLLGGVLGPISAIAIGVAWIALDVDKRIDEKYGRKARPEMWRPVEEQLNRTTIPVFQL